MGDSGMDRNAFRVCLLAVVFIVGLAVCSAPARMVDVGDSVRGLVEADWIRADVEFGVDKAVVSADRVTTAQDAAGGCDGVRNGGFGFHVASGETDPWWQVDLGRAVRLDRIVIHNRTDGGTATRTRNIQVLLSKPGRDSEFRLLYQHDGKVFYGGNK
ncbi:MAG TPA: discoidin domain-containing protein, partial [Phycisphaerales bacterium]|nr:discoidin domain-containing protein [Phycisphaerales bacterium]